MDIASESTPVGDALLASGSSFREALAMVITFLAAFVPWLIVIVPGLILFRLFWRWVGSWLPRFQRRPAG